MVEDKNRWKTKLERLAGRFEKLEDCDLMMIRNAGCDLSVWDAVHDEMYAEVVKNYPLNEAVDIPATSLESLIDFGGEGPVDLGSICLYLPTLRTLPIADVAKYRKSIDKLFQAAGATLEDVPETVLEMFDPLVLKFPRRHRWAGCLFFIAFQQPKGMRLSSRKQFADMSFADLNRIRMGKVESPKCWFASIEGALGGSVDLIDLLLSSGLDTSAPKPMESIVYSRRFRSVSEWLKLLAKLEGIKISEDTFLRRRKGTAVPRYRVNPESSRGSISIAIDDLPPGYSDDLTA